MRIIGYRRLIHSIDFLFHAGRVFFIGSLITPMWGAGVISGAPGIFLLVGSCGVFLGTWAGFRILSRTGYSFSETLSEFVWSIGFQANIPLLIVLGWKTLRTMARPPSWLRCWSVVAAIHGVVLPFTREFSESSGILWPYLAWIVAILLICFWLILKGSQAIATFARPST